MTDEHPRIWVLLGPRVGDNNQLLALAEALKLPFETRTVDHNILRRLPPRFHGASRWSVDSLSSEHLTPPWPDLVIGIGRRTVPLSRWIRAQNNGRTKLVRLGNPRLNPSFFDLVVTTPQYPVPEAPNVITLPLAMTRFRPGSEPSGDEREFLDRLPRPHLLLALGGRTQFWQMDEARMLAASRRLCRMAADAAGSLIVAPSPRTESHVLEAIAAISSHRSCVVVENNSPRFGVLLDDADKIFVTADSVSMISEAIATSKPVGMIPIDPTPGVDGLIGSRFALGGRDLRDFWKSLSKQGLVGTIDHPVTGYMGDPRATAAAAVLALLQKG